MPGSSFHNPEERSIVWLCKVALSGTFPLLVAFKLKRTVLPGAVVFTSDSTNGSSHNCISWNSFTVIDRVIESRRRVGLPAESG